MVSAPICVNVIEGAECHRSARPDRSGLDAEKALEACGASAVRLLHEECDGRGLEEKVKLAGRVLARRGVEEDAAI